ncbi:MAG TPA: hypothetical protein DER23_06430 [Clostridiales bacterium]|jgi:serine protease Do|nr:hypothetical protein [Clostridiales bacterium]HCG35963.1 hypothetical protein [Clostridiales bacterium]
MNDERVYPNHSDDGVTGPAQEQVANEPVEQYEAPQEPMQTSPQNSQQTPVYSYTPPMQHNYISYQQSPVHKHTSKGKTKKIIWGIVACILCLAMGLIAGGAVIQYGLVDLGDWIDGHHKPVLEDENKNNPASDSDDDNSLSTSGKNVKDANPPLSLKQNTNHNALSAAEIYKSSVNSVVGITTEGTTTNMFGQTTTTASIGSGFIIDEENGYILTNAHVVESGNTYRVSLYNGETYDATLIGHESENDVAVLKIEAKNLTALPLGDSNALVVGQDIVTIGNPLGELTYTLTRGIVSALNRAINIDGQPIIMFQIDAAVNPGNSGGPAIDSTGKVVGIVSAKYSSASIEGIGFCIPINDALHIAKELIRQGYVSGKPSLGINVKDYYGRGSYGYYYMYVRVEKVNKGSCAAKAGMKTEDVITAINGEEVASTSELVTKLKKFKAGDTVTITVYRNGDYRDLTVTLDEDKSGAVAS